MNMSMTQSLSAEEIAELRDKLRDYEGARPGDTIARIRRSKVKLEALLFSKRAALLAMASRLVELERRDLPNKWRSEGMRLTNIRALPGLAPESVALYQCAQDLEQALRASHPRAEPSDGERAVWIIEDKDGHCFGEFYDEQAPAEQDAAALVDAKAVRYVPASSVRTEQGGADLRAEHEAMTVLFQRDLAGELVLGDGHWYTYATDDADDVTPGAAALRFARHIGALPSPPAKNGGGT